ncbi:hypothetical protein MSAN_00232000 [Mycena sanguinolenta]|uniref:Uncharacterized protein n=1 Tax=Mycena sanguinolenta TaxID=230812 RepID=A0A8H6ZFK2_9AGAR|nr:hypothetical protein MSAN_00232000 [Mycena sanguinolenta]
MKYVLVPPAPYWVKRARLDWEARNERAGESRGRRWDSAHRSGSRRTYGYRSDLSSSRSRSRSTVDPRRRAPAPMKTKTKIMTQRKTETGEGQVHASLGDALNNSWAHNEAMGTIPVGRAAGEGAEKGKRKHEVQEDEKERLAKRPKRGKVATRQETEARESAKRKARAPRRPDNDMLVAPAVPPQSCGAWCEEGIEDGVGSIVRLHFDVTVAEADHAACAALLNTGIPGFNVEPAGVETSASLAEDVRGGLRPTCLVWPPRLEEGEYDVSAGESVATSSHIGRGVGLRGARNVQSYCPVQKNPSGTWNRYLSCRT